MRHFTTHPEFGPDAELIDPAELPDWIIEESEHRLVINKPGWVVCHPSKNGPWSSLAGALREYTGLDTLHLVSRLDRETSGLVLIAKHRAEARRLQMAFQERKVTKRYWTILHGQLDHPQQVRQPLAKDLNSQVAAKVTVRRSRSAQSAESFFQPLAWGGGYTLAEVRPETGRKHQIRAHAAWLGCPVAGDKLYGGDDTLFLEFITHGWTPRLAASLAMRRQALHCARLSIGDDTTDEHYHAPLSWDMRQFCREVMAIQPPE